MTLDQINYKTPKESDRPGIRAIISNGDALTHVVDTHKVGDNTYDVTFHNVYEGVGITYNPGQTRDLSGKLLNEYVTENFKNGSTLVRATGASNVKVGYLNRDNFIRYTFTGVTSPVVTLRITIKGEPPATPLVTE